MREFAVFEGCEKDFELVFRPDGVWVALLRPRSQGYVRTELQTASVSERRYKVLDYWRSHRDFELFRDAHQYDVEQFRDWLATKGLVERETLLGSFYTDEPDEDAGLVPA